MKKLIACVLLLASTTLIGCQVNQQRQQCVSFSRQLDYCLQMPDVDVLSQTHELTVLFERQQQRHELLLHVEIDNRQLIVVGLGPIGQALFTLTFDGQTLNSQHSALLGNDFKPEYILALIQMAYWPEKSVSIGLQQGNIFSDSLIAQSWRKVIDTEQQEVVMISYQKSVNPWLSTVTINIPEAHLTLTMTPLVDG